MDPEIVEIVDQDPHLERNLSQDTSHAKIEYKALLPQYKEFSSDSDFTKSRDMNLRSMSKKRDLSIDTLRNKSIDDQEPRVIVGKSIKLSYFVGRKRASGIFHKILVSRRKRLVENRSKPQTSAVYQSWSAKNSQLPSPSRVNDTKQLINMQVCVT